MAQTTETKITCDKDGCRKSVGDANDHIDVIVTGRIATNDLPGGGDVGSGSFDFCSWEHAAAFFKEHGKEAAKLRDERIEATKEQAAASAPQPVDSDG